MRKDGEQNREKLIKAAREILLAEDADLPMEAVAARAGLTRGTLYRNFENREEMYWEVLNSEVDMARARLKKDNAAHPLAFIRSVTELIMLHEKFRSSVADISNYAMDVIEGWILELIEIPLAIAQGYGLLSDRLTCSDILLVCRMLAPHGRMDQQLGLSAVINSRMDLLLRGISGVTDPGPSNL